MTIIGLVPARQGSKGLPNKNMKILNGKPLIYYSIVQSLKASSIDRTIFSTDSEEYQKYALSLGAEAPCLRSKFASSDTATDGHVYEEIIETLNLNSNDIIVHLRPTNPSRSIYLIDKVVKRLIETGADAIRTISKSRFSPYKMVAVENGCIADILPQPNKFLGTDQPRQILPETFELNGNVDAFCVSNIQKYGSAYPADTLGFIEESKTADIDTLDDFNNMENLLTAS